MNVFKLIYLPRDKMLKKKVKIPCHEKITNT